MGELRFIVGSKGIASSDSWKAWRNKADIYLLQRNMGQIQKFSLHESGNCRWALNKAQNGENDRVIKKWVRGSIPPVGSGQAVTLMSLVFPTDHLSAPRNPTKNTIWIKSAPTGQAVAVEFALTAEDEATTRKLLGQVSIRDVLHFEEISSDVNWLVTTTQFTCGDVSLTVPAAPNVTGVVFGHLEFPSSDTTGSGRPVRMLLYQPRTEQNPTFWELGGFRAEPSISLLKT